jgi:hypothetical protein
MMNSIQAGPHYEVQSSDLASWLEEQAASSWWNVDGDPLLTGQIPFPCPTDELVSELRNLDRSLLIQARKGDLEAKGQPIDVRQIDKLVDQFATNVHSNEKLPPWTSDRFFYLCWKGSPLEWMLAEDSVTAQQYREEATHNPN